ncbi:hypothetical protein ANN_01609 [Periplaneta americana]|uniref:Transmembrane protein n=1 Tax=Periplaneta americana TaxID=6978 RepID=A0ABQ8TVU4_PERAM|nr:hypothetical protein ANN_01609 [Periplaneta americana]
MAGLCEGVNEPPGSLKAAYRPTYRTEKFTLHIFNDLIIVVVFHHHHHHRRRSHNIIIIVVVVVLIISSSSSFS